MDRKKTRQIYGRRSVATLLTLTGTLLWAVPVVRGADPTNASDYRFIRVAALGETVLDVVLTGFSPYDANKRGDSLFVGWFDDGADGSASVNVRTQGRISLIAYALGIPQGYVPINDNGDVAFGTNFNKYFYPPVGLENVLYRYRSATQELTDITPSVGGYDHISLNNRGDIVFNGLDGGSDIDPRSAPGCNLSSCEYGDLGMGVFRIDQSNKFYKVVKPGDKAPGGRVFDWATDPWINDRGDVAFAAHLRGDPCDFDQSYEIYCPESLYLRTGLITRSIAHLGDREPGRGIYRRAFGPIVNNSAQVVYIGDRIAPDRSESNAVYLYSGGVARAVALAGDNMPGGGKLVSVSSRRGDYDINNLGQISFSAVLNEDRNHDGAQDTALYVFTPGSAATQSGPRVKGTGKLVIRTGSYIPGIGTVKYLGVPWNPPYGSGGMMNDKARMLVQVTTTNDLSLLLWAVPQT